MGGRVSVEDGGRREGDRAGRRESEKARDEWEMGERTRLGECIGEVKEGEIR